MVILSKCQVTVITLETTPLLLKIKHPNNQTDQSSNNETPLIVRLESKLLSRFDNLSTEFLNLKVVIIKNLQTEFLISIKELYPLNLIVICSNNMGDETTSKLQAFLILFWIMNWKIK